MEFYDALCLWMKKKHFTLLWNVCFIKKNAIHNSFFISSSGKPICVWKMDKFVKSEPKILEEITNKRKGDILDIHDVKQG